MHRYGGRAVLLLLGGVLVLGLVALAWAIGAGSSEAQQDSMQNCPQPGKWAISVWDGDDNTDTAEALATCGDGVAYAYYIDPDTQDWQRWFAARPDPDVSNLRTLDSMQAVLAYGAVGTPQPTPTPTLTPTPTATPTVTPSPVPTASPIVFTGKGDKTTSVFSVSSWSFTVSWTTDSNSPEYALLGFFVYREGETTGSVCSAQFDGVGSDSTVCRGGPGQFYIEVLAANLSSWRIGIGGAPPVSGLPATFTGRGDKATPAFHATASSFTVSWTTESDSPEYALLGFFVYPEGETIGSVCSADFDGVGSDSTVCYAGSGDFYIEVLAANLSSWRLDITQ